MPNPKKVKVDLIPLEESEGVMSEPYRILQELVSQVPQHTNLCELNFRLVWRFEVKPDQDERIQAGWIKILDEVQRIEGKDVEIKLNHEYWTHPNTTDEQRRYILDDLLSQVALQRDPETGESKQDSDGRYLLRRVQHDVRIFTSVEERYSSEVNLSMRKFLQVLALRRKVEGGDRYGVDDGILDDDDDYQTETVLTH